MLVLDLLMKLQPCCPLLYSIGVFVPGRHIAIFGQYKTGTTALFYQIKDSLSPPLRTLLEPRRYNPEPGDASANVLAKVILGLYKGPAAVRYEDFTPFPSKVLLLRDPRDRIVSGTLFIIQQTPAIHDDPARLAEALDLLRRKESDPRSISLSEVLGEILRLAGGKSLAEAIDELHEHHRWIYRFADDLGGHFQLKYEDLVDGHIGALEAYLGFPLCKSPRVDSENDHVLRRRKHGDWMNWFLPDDVRQFRSVTEEYLAHFGYPLDWQINSDPVIRPEHCSGYVERTVGKRHQMAAAQSK